MSNEASNKISVKEIASELGISTTTVSRTLSGKGRVGEDTKKRILDFIRANDYQPNIRQKGFKQTRNICVTLPGEKDFAELPFFSKILLSIYDYFEPRDYNIIPIKLKAGDINPLIKLVENQKIDGVIFTRSIQESKGVRYLQQQGVPFVIVGSFDDKSVWQVDVDQENGCRELTSILIKKGMRRIALFCADRTHEVTKSRYKGFVKAFRENDIPIDQNLIFDEAGYEIVADKAVEDMLKEQIECIVCMDDNICLNVVNKLRREKVNIPGDIRVASFYNSWLLNSSETPITCLDFNVSEMGTEASKMLLDILEGDTTPKKVLLGYQVILKQSTK
ncbi:MAG: LacI family DNA-binding transcriptional regulator [Lachnospiraceae bacterium]|nr:LacI family DNA-binding transcriptional regulator [Lachnospiraceae bacterium]